MTKDGRPSLLNDIRHFSGTNSYLHGHEDAVAFGRRLAWYLNGERVSLGAYTARHLLFTPSLGPGTVRIVPHQSVRAQMAASRHNLASIGPATSRFLQAPEVARLAR